VVQAQLIGVLLGVVGAGYFPPLKLMARAQHTQQKAMVVLVVVPGQFIAIV
jgi:hypothetical protein